MEQLKKGLESGTVLIQFEVRDLRADPPVPLWAAGCCRIIQLTSWPCSSRDHGGARGLREGGGWRPRPAPELCLTCLF